MRLLPVAVAALALASAGLGAVDLWPLLGEAHGRWADADATEADRAAARDARLPPEVFEFFAARVDAGDRYYVHVPRGRRMLLTDQAGVVRMFAAYALLPAVQVASPAQATVVVSYRAEPEELGLRYAAVDRLAGREPASVARLAR